MPWTPPIVAEWAGRFHDATGLDVEVTRPADTRWRLTMANDRVTTTMDFKTTGHRIVHAGSTLTVDGHRVPLADDLPQLARIFADPDGADQPQPPAEPLPPFPPERPAHEAPAAVAQQYQQLAGKIGDAATVRLGLNEHHLWLIDVATDRATIRFGLGYYQHTWRIVGLRVIIDGLDRSDEANGNLTAALALLVHTGEPTPGQPAVTDGAPAARSNAVETRRSTVIRN